VTAADRLRARLVRLIATRRRAAWARLLARAARSYLDWVANLNYDPATNGEARVLRIVAATSPGVVLDVGAHVGEWSLAAAREAPGAEVHAFEIVPATVKMLRERVAGTPAIVVHGIGLDTEPGEVQVTHFPDSPEQSGIGTPGTGGRGEQLTARVTAGDLVLAERGIERVGLLKIDVEGAELRVLRGFSEALGRGAIDVIQFEYGRANIGQRALLADLYELLTSAGYVVGKIYPEDVAFGPYHPATHEDFRGPNFVAVRGDRADLRRSLEGVA
jgi:FkbM family methyltransferase